MFPAQLVVPGPTCDNRGKRRGGAAVVVAVRGRAPRSQSLRDPPLARGACFACPPCVCAHFVGLWWFAASTSICPRLVGQDHTGEPSDAYFLSAHADFSKVVVSCALATSWGSVAKLCAFSCALPAAGCCLGVGLARRNLNPARGFTQGRRRMKKHTQPPVGFEPTTCRFLSGCSAS